MKRTHSSSKNAGNRPSDAARETDADRARAIVASLRTREPSSDEMFEAFWQLDTLPVNDVRQAFTSWLGPLPDIDRLDPATRLAHGFPPPALRLRTLSVTRDADVLDIGPVAEEQLRIAGQTWDGADLAPEDRLDGELEGSLAGTLERRVLADVDAPETPLFDVLLVAEDSGVVFASGTKTVIALIAYRKVETRDRRVRTAVEDALFAPAVVVQTEPLVAGDAAVEASAPVAKAVQPKSTVPAEAVAPTTKVAQKSATKKGAPKKTATQKTPTIKTVAKKTVAKKTVAKKTVAKKTVAKKRAPTKTAAKKTAAKSKGTKQTAAKKKTATAKQGATKIDIKKAAAAKRAVTKNASPKKARKAR